MANPNLTAAAQANMANVVVGAVGPAYAGVLGGIQAGGAGYQFAFANNVIQNGYVQMAPYVASQITVDAKTKMLITLHGEQYENYDELENARTLYPTNFYISDSEVTHFHFIVWKEIYGEEIKDHGTLLRSQRGMFVVFGSEASRDHFERFLIEYEDRFFEGRDFKETTIPEPKNGDIRGVFVQDIGLAEHRHRLNGTVLTQRMEEWIWIVRNCRHPVVLLKNGWIFGNDAEAIHFKMRS